MDKKEITVNRIIEKLKKLEELRKRKQELIPVPLSKSDSPQISPAL